MIKVRRTEAKVALLQFATQLEQYAVLNKSYIGATLDQLNTPNNFYKLNIDSIAADSYRISATPQGSQQKDTECGSYTLDQMGRRGEQSECW